MVVRGSFLLGVGGVLALVACGKGGEGGRHPAPAAAPSEKEPAAPKPKRVRKFAPAEDTLPAAAKLAVEQRALQVVAGSDSDLSADRFVERAAAKARGLGLVDLSDGWAPSLFADGVAPDGGILQNRYRSTFVGLANDRTDGDGQPLREGERNFLEPYGIPPSLSVLRRRFLQDGAATCWAGIDGARLLAVDQIPVFGAETERKERERERLRGERLEAARVAAGVATLEDITDPALQKELAAHKRALGERAAFAEAEKRLVCEGLLDGSKHAAGRYDTPMRFAMLAFQQKNLIMAQGDITRGTLEALARPALASDFLALQRTLAERVADAGGFIEDGSAPDVPDLIGQGTAAVLLRLGIETPEDALEFFRRRGPADFRDLVVAVRLPAPPDYYADHMDLHATINRGDVWYDFPFDAKGNRLPQPRRRYPGFSLAVRTKNNGADKDGTDRDVTLLHWRTTIGGWRSELASDGQEYLRYKDSDVGPRVWRHVVAAPVWVPPPSTPLGGFVKEKWVNGAIIKVPNQDETGPGYLSAYGLVAGIHVEPRRQGKNVYYFDNGIRTHGTFDYTSLRGRFSHGCHRLENHLAVRLFSFVLRHRKVRPLGPMALDFRTRFYSGGEVFDLRLPSRGFYYELEPPLPVDTLPGTIKGQRTQPPVGYVPKPGVVYARRAAPAAPAGPESKAGGAASEKTDSIGAP